MGREETAWGAVGNIKALGCLGGGDLPENSTPKQIIDHQLSCIFRNFTSDMSCEAFMCKYSGDGEAPCVFNNNPNFAVNLPPIYDNLVE